MADYKAYHSVDNKAGIATTVIRYDCLEARRIETEFDPDSEFDLIPNRDSVIALPREHSIKYRKAMAKLK